MKDYVLIDKKKFDKKAQSLGIKYNVNVELFWKALDQATVDTSKSALSYTLSHVEPKQTEECYFDQHQHTINCYKPVPESVKEDCNHKVKNGEYVYEPTPAKECEHFCTCTYHEPKKVELPEKLNKDGNRVFLFTNITDAQMIRELIYKTDEIIDYLKEKEETNNG